MVIAGIEWDDANWPRCGKHGVSREEIEAMLSDDPAVYLDPLHSADEQRYRAIGMSSEGRRILVAFTFRNNVAGRWLRPIGARYMHRKEILRYGRSH
jgi:uncharacterized DUF497 family protein